jgi:phosphoglycerate-specific signal transduction histidine kinase
MTMKFIKQLLCNIRKTIMTDNAEKIEKIDEQIKSLSDSYIKLVGKDDGSKYDESELGKNSKTLTEKQTELTNKKTQLEDDKNKKEDSQDHRSRVSAQLKRLQNFLTSPRPQQDVTFCLKNLLTLGGKDLVVDDGAHWNFSRIF